MRNWGKDHLRYWGVRIFLQRGSPNYFVHLQCHRERHKLSLGTSNPTTAAARARALYEEIQVNGWAETLNNRRQTPVFNGVNHERCHKRLSLLREELAQRPNGDRLDKRFWEIVRGIGCTNCGFNKCQRFCSFIISIGTGKTIRWRI
jgi:hypothetical protein